MKHAAIVVFATLLAASTGAETVSSVVALPQNAADGRECCVTGVVTMAAIWRDHALALADPLDLDGPALYVTSKAFPDVRVGDRCEVSGRLFAAFRSCGIRATSFRRLDSVALPPAPPLRLSEIVHGGRNLRRVRLSGVLRRAEGTAFEIGTPEGVFDAHVDGASEGWGSLVNATVELEGVVLASYTHHGKFVGTLLAVGGEGSVRVLEPPPDESLPFHAPMDDPHARTISGTVTYVEGGAYFVVQNDSDTAFVVVSKDESPPSVGDVVDVCGFATPDDDIGEIRSWKTSVSQSGAPLPAPIVLKGLGLFKTAESPAQGFNGLTGCRVTVSGELVDMHRTDAGYELGVAVPDGIVGVVAPPGLAGEVLSAAPYRPEIEVSGVALIAIERSLAADPIPDIVSFKVLVSDPGEVRLEPGGAWRSRRRSRNVTLAVFATGMLAILLLVAKVYVDRRGRARLRAIIAERKRMSADLHDTIEQNLAVANMVINSPLLVDDGVPREVASAIGAVSDLLARTKKEIREVILNLRSDELFEKSPAEIFQDLADGLSRSGALRVRTRLRGLPARLNGAVCADLVYVVREAVANAIRHGGARTILIVSDATPSGFLLTVANNGRPFNPQTAPGPADGHFGISGMRARARRSGFSLRFGRKGRLSTLSMEVNT